LIHHRTGRRERTRKGTLGCGSVSLDSPEPRPDSTSCRARPCAELEAVGRSRVEVAAPNAAPAVVLERRVVHGAVLSAAADARSIPPGEEAVSVPSADVA